MAHGAARLSGLPERGGGLATGGARWGAPRLRAGGVGDGGGAHALRCARGRRAAPDERRALPLRRGRHLTRTLVLTPDQYPDPDPYPYPNPLPDPNQADICCPLIAWLEGKQYNNVQTAHAIGGLGELLQQNGAVFELGLASVDSPDAPPMSPEQVTGGIKHSNPSPTPTPAASPHPSPCLSPDQVCRAAMSLDLTRPEECEKAELTLRHACLMQALPTPTLAPTPTPNPSPNPSPNPERSSPCATAA